MALKSNSLKLLSWLHPIQVEAGVSDPFLYQKDLEFFLPTLTGGGRRSLVKLLENQHFLVKQRSPEGTLLRITTHGRDALAEQVPLFHSWPDSWQGEWSIVTFLDAPSSDAAFRHLRSKLVQAKAGQLKRGVYLYPGVLPVSLQSLLKELYRGHVVVWKSNQWRFGDEHSVVSSLFQLSDVIETYSGISKEVSRLLTNRDGEKRLTDRAKKTIFLAYDRLFTVLLDDLGLVSYYFPQVDSFYNLRIKLHQLYLL